MSCITCAVHTVSISTLSIEAANSTKEERNIALFTPRAEQKRRAFSTVSSEALAAVELASLDRIIEDVVDLAESTVVGGCTGIAVTIANGVACSVFERISLHAVRAGGIRANSAANNTAAHGITGSISLAVLKSRGTDAAGQISRTCDAVCDVAALISTS